ncbi:hypothetical protein VTI74DRAFT_9955 [Chaetomium olivicolor]
MAPPMPTPEDMPPPPSPAPSSSSPAITSSSPPDPSATHHSGELSSSPASAADATSSGHHTAPSAPQRSPTEKGKPDQISRRRARTRTEDREVLEAYFAVSDKPDKKTRLEIVNKVNMTEKQVQIWFQNRRQEQRRKLRPFTQVELQDCVIGAIPRSQVAPSDDYAMHLVPHGAPPAPNMLPLERPAAVLPSPSPPSVHSGDELEKTPASSQELGRDSAPEPHTTAPALAGKIGGHAPSRSFAGPVGYVSNRWNAASSFHAPPYSGRDDPFRRRSYPSPYPASTAPGAAVPPTSSQPAQLRLSMSLEGKAEVVVPSPPRPSTGPPPSDPIQPIRRPELQSSCSESRPSLPPMSEFLSSALPQKNSALPPRYGRGRSRDVYAWEFCCDSENCDDPLTAHAKHESSGSATAQISLIRSMSASSNGSSREKRVASSTLSRPGEGKRPRLSRSESSMARMETTAVLGASHRHNSNLQRAAVAPADKYPNLPSKRVSMWIENDDSEKENRSPDRYGNPRPSGNGASSARRPLSSGPSRPLDKIHPRRTQGHNVGGRRSPALLSSRAHTAPTGSSYNRRGTRGGESPFLIHEDGEDDDPEVDGRHVEDDDEISRFMGRTVSPSKNGDAAAVAGLLQLRKGQWR